MPANRLNISMKTKGVIFDRSKTKAAAARTVTAMNELLADEAVIRVRAKLKNVLRNPTGYYSSRIDTRNTGVSWFVWDSNVPYGGWLEGVDRRNKTTRFKGYKTFRLIKEQMKQDSDRIVAPAVKQFIDELNS